ncbi:DMT family transporter [Aliikangiella marina]|uniref:DMT family transporter n=1 Tax=Aliikangiella marina TaxID=1712262 RepID=A0A545TDG5_9GAMM|nr:DMT family transporter [Aliikangiella marina]TQV75262.1 DMT family transporter [Aliikangiella marina]
MTYSNHQFKLGLIFISTAVIFWGVLPVALKVSGGFIDAISLTWVRFLIALVFSLVSQWLVGQLGQFKLLTFKQWAILSIAGVFLITNYVTFVWSLDYLGPGEAQLNFQTAPFYLALGGLIFFKERISGIQAIFFSFLAFGLLLFFHKNITGIGYSTNIIWGIIFVQLSSFCWCVYALMQKWLNQVLSPANILLFIFALGVIILFPQSRLTELHRYSFEQYSILLFCSINTIIAYGCFAQSMKYWRAVEVSAMIALTPIASFATAMLAAYMGWWPEIITFPAIDLVSCLGIVLVVTSAACVQIWNRQPVKTQQDEKSDIK